MNLNLNSKKKQQPIKTFLRIKPIDGYDQSTLFHQRNSVSVKKTQLSYSFDDVFGESVTNQQIFDAIGEPIIQHSFLGYNSCVLAYGQTSSGKTYTMKGEEENMGLIPLTIKKLFEEIQKNKQMGQVKISYVQIYNENIIDLLSSNTSNSKEEQSLQIREKQGKIQITGIVEPIVTNVQQSMKIFEKGESKRRYGSTNLNVTSSRSHTIFRIMVQTINSELEKFISYINMVDLAGSEGVSRTKAQGATKKQGENINKSILALSNVIRSMSQRQAYTNFRDSKLTRILQTSLCSNSKSVVICTVNPTGPNLQQTINTLKFGYDASQIKITAKQNYQENKLDKSAEEGYRQDYGLQPQQRIEYQENKRLVHSLREQIQKYENTTMEKQAEIARLQMQNHNLIKELQNNRNRDNLRNSKSTQMYGGDRELLEKEIAKQKSQMHDMAYRYQLLVQQNSKLQNNQKYLLIKITKYENELQMLKNSVSAVNHNTIINRPQTPMKPKKVREDKLIDECPLKLGSMVELKTQIIKLKISLYEAHEDIASLIRENNQLNQERDHDERSTGKYNVSHYQDKKYKALLHKVKILKNELESGRRKQKKMTDIIRSYSERGIREFDEFNEFLSKRGGNSPASSRKLRS